MIQMAQIIELSTQTMMIPGAVWLLFCAWRGHQKGFLREIYSLAELVLSLVFMWFLSGHVSFMTDGVNQLSGFLVIWFVFRWIGKFLNIVNRIPVLGGLNKTLGVLLGFFLGLLVLGLFIVLLGYASNVEQFVQLLEMAKNNG